MTLLEGATDGKGQTSESILAGGGIQVERDCESEGSDGERGAREVTWGLRCAWVSGQLVGERGPWAMGQLGVPRE